MRLPRILREPVLEETILLDVRLDELAADRLRRLISDLFDRAALAVNRSGFDLDDAVVENTVLCRAGEGGVEVSIGYISDGAALERTIILTVENNLKTACAASEVLVCGIRSRAFIERWKDGPQ